MLNSWPFVVLVLGLYFGALFIEYTLRRKDRFDRDMDARFARMMERFDTEAKTTAAADNALTERQKALTDTLNQNTLQFNGMVGALESRIRDLELGAE